MTELQILKELTDKITGILNGKVSTTSLHKIDEGDISSQPDEIKALYERINLLCEKNAEASQFMLQLSKGSLDQDPPKANFLISPFKELHSSLRHMIWQTQRIADGDYNQHINFMGDFSTSFNQLIESLRQKQAAELALQKSEERARLFLENATDVIFVLDLNLNLIYISPACLNIFGYTDEECMQMPLNSLFSESVMLDQKNKMAEYIGQYRQTGVNRIISFEGQIPHRAGQSIWIEATMRILPDKNGEIIGIQGSARDISQRRYAEKALLQKNKDLEELNATKDKFFSIIAHDLRGPIGSMHSLLELISEPDIQTDKEQYYELLNVMKDVSKTTFDLLENLLIWANSQRGSIEFLPKFYNLHKLVEQNISLFTQAARNKEITLVNKVPASCVGYFDYNMINTVVRNLLNNAIKYTRQQGNVSVTAVVSPPFIDVSVSDDGVGMKPETISKLFKIDTVSKSTTGTAGESGTGLGLLLCNEFVKKHAGNIKVQSEPGSGSTFMFSIPNNLNA